ncbi:DNA repair protein [Loktanella sp. SALINAS62]|uniref:DNA repair protein n=1 Tax=Loktanella sp. SALINAS62 TaxID=2706124 RepID=UPI001B8D6D9C|nr:DNA repair protein [Loktanella sp. SALINAS62]
MSLSIRLVVQTLHAVSLFVVAVVAVAAVTFTMMSALGFAGWLAIDATIGGVAYPQAGLWLQIAVTAILVAMAFFLPTNARLLQLERSHRDFQISMDDVKIAYNEVHHADRKGVFTLSSEFDAVRERLAYLRDHPDLTRLEPQVLEVAAQMGQTSRHLAEVYSEERIARAKAFLTARQKEAEDQQEQILEALHICEQIRSWSAQVEMEESRVASQLAHLDESLQNVLPLLGYALEHDTSLDRDDGDSAGHVSNIVPLAQKPAAE